MSDLVKNLERYRALAPSLKALEENIPSKVGHWSYLMSEKEADQLLADLGVSVALNMKFAETARYFINCQYPVSEEIDDRGHSWNRAYLEELLPTALKTLALAEQQGIK